MSSRTYQLTQLHGRLDDRVRAEMKSRAPDSLRLLQLKRMRLRVKDRLHMLTRAQPAG